MSRECHRRHEQILEPAAYKVRYKDFSYPEALMPAKFKKVSLTGQETVEELFAASDIIHRLKEMIEVEDGQVRCDDQGHHYEIEKLMEAIRSQADEQDWS